MSAHEPERCASRSYVEASALLASVRDVVDERPDGATLPSWCEARGWTRFLEGLSLDAVLSAERDGFAVHAEAFASAPDDLVELARAVARVTALPAAGQGSADGVEARRASPRKRAQVAAFEALARGVAQGRTRVVDVGSGHGHLTRHLARALDVSAEGWERDPARVAVASSLTTDGRARFVAVDARDLAATLTPSDLVVGLHACGALGDQAVRAAAEAGASVAIVGCCLQKRDGDRAPLGAPAGIAPSALTIGRGVLGLGNAYDSDGGVEADLTARTASRIQRYALRTALHVAGCDMESGGEMRGVNRRRATGDFDELVDRAFAARGLTPPAREVTDDILRAARDDYERARRWALPRTMLARLIEVWVALDRAALLARHGYAVDVVAAFDASVSPRNVAVLGRPLR